MRMGSTVAIFLSRMRGLIGESLSAACGRGEAKGAARAPSPLIQKRPSRDTISTTVDPVMPDDTDVLQK